MFREEGHDHQHITVFVRVAKFHRTNKPKVYTFWYFMCVQRTEKCPWAMKILDPHVLEIMPTRKKEENKRSWATVVSTGTTIVPARNLCGALVMHNLSHMRAFFSSWSAIIQLTIPLICELGNLGKEQQPAWLSKHWRGTWPRMHKVGSVSLPQNKM